MFRCTSCPRIWAPCCASLPPAGFVGINVTIPHKEAVLALADSVTDRAALIGAANTLIFRPDGKIHADNTDGYGFIANLRQICARLAARSGPAAVIGAGGAARAVVAALLECGVTEFRDHQPDAAARRTDQGGVRRATGRL